MKKDKKGSTTKKILTVMKKSNEMESKKAKEKKLKKKHKPKGMGAKRMGMLAFWFMFIFMFVVMLSGMFQTSADVDSDSILDLTTNNKIKSNEAIEFTKDFVYEYFTWTTDKHGSDLRKDKLSPYLTSEVDALGGLIYDNEWSSSIKMSDITLKDVQGIDDNKSRFIFKVKFELKGETDDKDTEVDIDKLNFEETKKFERSIRVKGGYKTKITQKYISVPVFYDEEKNRFAVYELPSFTYLSEGDVKNAGKNSIEKLKRVTDTFTENNLNAFTETFFESYSKDSRDKLNYILEDERHMNGLNGSMDFVSIEKIDIFHVDENNNKFIVDTKILLSEPSTKLEFTNDYLLVVKRKDQRYIVESLNDEQFIDEIIDEYIKVQDDEDEQAEGELNDEGFNYLEKLELEENENDNNNNS